MTEWMKTSQIKSGEKLVFQPTEEEGIERFSLWDVKNKKFLREGDTIKTEKGVQEVTKYIKLSDEEKKSYGRNLKVLREIVVDGKLYSMDFPVTVDTALKQAMTSIKEDVGADPLEYEYILKRQGEGLKTTYFVMSGKNVGKPVVQEAEEASSSNPIITNITNLNLTKRQQEVVEKIKEDNVSDESDRFRIMKRYGFGEELADKVNKTMF